MKVCPGPSSWLAPSGGRFSMRQSSRRKATIFTTGDPGPMGASYSEVSGDPVAYRRSPAFHKTWLSALGIQGDYLATPVSAAALADHIAGRRADPDWRGCNVTMPHKQAILPLLEIGRASCRERVCQ